MFLHSLIVAISFNPQSRYFHNSVHIKDKLFFLGGSNDNSPCLSDFFYLDLTLPFHKDIPPWYNLDFRKIPFCVSGAFSSFGGFDDSTIFLIGGNRSIRYHYYVSSFNTKTFVWSHVSIDQSNLLWQRNMQGVTNDKGEIYVYGGWTLDTNSSSNKLNILDTVNLKWMTGPNSQVGHFGHTATLLSNGIIVIIGGNVNDKCRLNKIWLYNTNKSDWSSMNTQGILLSNRIHHSAVLTKNDRIIVYGGIKDDTNATDPDLVVLDTKVLPFSWSAPKVNIINSPPLLYEHSANMIGDYMIVTFERGYTINTEILPHQFILKSN
ncbi:6892_t:CDS:2 [Diversispora eburnea]|uniref:6892_t:CDS:1 n=1 Tax=Diversispora eburnea TaxID=1213867 RepID=A0A9N8YNN9_9GLOM|nr:6892_t:CDS:2 [Diversispora eburnea]